MHSDKQNSEIILELQSLIEYKHTLEKLLNSKFKNVSLLYSCILLLCATLFCSISHLYLVGYFLVGFIICSILTIFSYIPYSLKLRHLSKMKGSEIELFIDKTNENIKDIELKLITLLK